MIPRLVGNGGIWKVLPPGIHDATMDEIQNTFAHNEIRTALFEGFRQGSELLEKAGCTLIYLDGSFVTEKSLPGDFDACWDSIGVDINRLDPIFLDFTDGRKRQKERFGGEFFPSSANANGVVNFVEFFQQDRYSSKKKGLIRVHLHRI